MDGLLHVLATFNLRYQDEVGHREAEAGQPSALKATAEPKRLNEPH